MRRTLSVALALAGMLCAGTLVSTMAGNNKGKSDEKILGEPKEDQALVYFMRDGAMVGKAVSFYVFDETQMVTALENNSYNFRYMSPGNHVLWWGLPFPGLEVDLEAGEVYYVDMTGSFKRRDRMIDEQAATELLGRIKSYYEPTEKNRKKADKMVRKHYAKVKALPPEVSHKYCPYPEEFFPIRPSQSIAIQSIELQATSEYPQEVTDKWAEELPRLIAKALKSQGYKNVSYAGAENSDSADVILAGNFVQLKKGSGMARTFKSANAQAAAFMRVDFSIAPASEPGLKVLIPCARTGYGVGGVLLGAMAASSKRIMHNNMERIAERLAEIIAESAGNGKKK